MNIEECIERVNFIKVRAFQEAKSFADGTFDPKICGYKSKEEAVCSIILRADKEAEKLILQFEKENPL
jgi:hypothetical protein